MALAPSGRPLLAAHSRMFRAGVICDAWVGLHIVTMPKQWAGFFRSFRSTATGVEALMPAWGL